MRPPDRREIARSPDLCNWRVRAGPRGVDEELRLPGARPGARRPSLECQSRQNSLDSAPEVVKLMDVPSSQSGQDRRWCIGNFSIIKSPRTPEARARTHFDCSCFHFFHPVTYPFGEKCYQALRATAATRQVPQNGGTPSSLRLRAAARSARPRQHRPRAKFVEGLLSEQQRAYGAQRTRGASS